MDQTQLVLLVYTIGVVLLSVLRGFLNRPKGDADLGEYFAIILWPGALAVCLFMLVIALPFGLIELMSHIGAELNEWRTRRATSKKT